MDWTSYDEYREMQEILLSKYAEGELDPDIIIRLTDRIYDLGREENGKGAKTG